MLQATVLEYPIYTLPWSVADCRATAGCRGVAPALATGGATRSQRIRSRISDIYPSGECCGASAGCGGLAPALDPKSETVREYPIYISFRIVLRSRVKGGFSFTSLNEFFFVFFFMHITLKKNHRRIM